MIFCGHFPDGAEKFTKVESMVGESRGHFADPAPDAGQCQLRSRTGVAVHEREPVLPDLLIWPSNRLHQVSPECAKSATSTTCPTPQAHSRCSARQRGARSPKVSLPDRYLRDTVDDAPKNPQPSGCSLDSSRIYAPPPPRPHAVAASRPPSPRSASWCHTDGARRRRCRSRTLRGRKVTDREPTQSQVYFRAVLKPAERSA